MDEIFKDNVDAWIKQIRREVSELYELPSLVCEQTDNIQHNYELIYDLKDQIEDLKLDIQALKLALKIVLKQKGDKCRPVISR